MSAIKLFQSFQQLSTNSKLTKIFPPNQMQALNLLKNLDGLITIIAIKTTTKDLADQQIVSSE